MKTAAVLVDLSLDKTWDYIVPPELEDRALPGVYVNVPLGRANKPHRACIVSLQEIEAPPPGVTLKTILSICEFTGVVPKSLVKLGRWMADYYCCSRERALRCLLPGAVRSGKIKPRKMVFYNIKDSAEAGDYIVKNAKRSPSRVKIMKELMTRPRGVSKEGLLKAAGASDAALRELMKTGLIEKEERTVDADPFKLFEIIPSQPKAPTAEQAAALAKIKPLIGAPAETRPNALLLHGVTGSGKTEVYLQTIAAALEKNLDSIVLVPEISLTPQTVERFRSRFGDMVSVLHSRLGDQERFSEWSKIYDGRVKIAVGARSALFSPFSRLGLIIVDEEHESSYKQSEAPRYHARDVAVMRGIMESALVILGSATPSLESYSNAASGKYALAELTKRIDGCSMPDIRIIDSRRNIEAGDGGSVYFSKDLVDAVRWRLERGEQIILFMNRRGYARQMICPNCGFVSKCSDCSAAHTYHKSRGTLSCYLCGSVISAYQSCPDCGSKEIAYTGAGTEKIEDIAARLFKGARVARMDSDTMTGKHSHERTLNDFKKGALDILVGTQMIAKGLDFPNVTLVGIINADQSLYIPDFRAGERTFQLITQVGGRAGRGEIKGEVMIQTFSPFNRSILLAAEHDYKGFFEEELAFRRENGFPPCARMAALFLKSEFPEKAMAAAEQIMAAVKPLLTPEIIVQPPAPAPIERVKTQHRFVATFRGKNLKALREKLRALVLSVKPSSKVDAYLDIDPVNLL
jgi:primosomal protein N' (replication factor Y)